jgi:hypothetical protein
MQKWVVGGGSEVSECMRNIRYLQFGSIAVIELIQVVSIYASDTTTFCIIIVTWMGLIASIFIISREWIKEP